MRSPGPEEIKKLAQSLGVSPAYLMCLSDEKQFSEQGNPSQLIPLLNSDQACEAKLYTDASFEREVLNDVTFLSVSTVLLPKISLNTFALKIEDDSMSPEIRVSDVLVVEPSILAKPGDYVAVKIGGESKVIVNTKNCLMPQGILSF